MAFSFFFQYFLCYLCVGLELKISFSWTKLWFQYWRSNVETAKFWVRTSLIKGLCQNFDRKHLKLRISNYKNDAQVYLSSSLNWRKRKSLNLSMNASSGYLAVFRFEILGRRLATCLEVALIHAGKNKKFTHPNNFSFIMKGISRSNSLLFI